MLLSGDHNDLNQILITPKLVILPVVAIIKYIVANCNLFVTHGKTKYQLDNGEDPNPIEFIATADGAAMNVNHTMVLSNIRLIDEHICSLIRLHNTDESLLSDHIQSKDGVILISLMNGSDNIINNYTLNYYNYSCLQKLNDNNEYIDIVDKSCDAHVCYYFKINTVFPMDKKAQCANSVSGGNSYHSSHMCILCTSGSTNKGDPSFLSCQRCTDKRRVCYCQQIFDHVIQHQITIFTIVNTTIITTIINIFII